MTGLEDRHRIRRGWTDEPDPALAVESLWRQLNQPNIAVVIFFCSPRYDRDAVASAMRTRFGTATLVGCTTAGEIGLDGYADASIAGLSLAGPEFWAVAEPIDQLERFGFQQARDAVGRALGAMARSAPEFDRSQMFAFLMIDGLCAREEAVVSALHANLGEIPLFGGSAGDDLSFAGTWIYADGAFRQDVGLLLLVGTTCPFRVFKTEHFISDDVKMVVTEADMLTRRVAEINGEPAAREYARMVGLDTAALTPMVFAAHPVVVRVGGNYYVRSIQKVNEDESLTFFCAIDEGIVLTVARGVDMAENLRSQFDELRSSIGEVQLVLGCDCVLRNLELQHNGGREQMSRILAENKVIGFSTYGEQYNAMHVNQTFTGVAIGTRA